MLPRTTVILNCRLVTPEGEIDSGVVVVAQARIAAAGQDYFLALPPNAMVVDAGRGLVGMGSEPFMEPAPLVVGAPAHLICRDRFQQVAWVMKEGRFVYPSHLWHAQTWPERRRQALRAAIAALQARPEHIHLEDVSESQAPLGIDLLWTFRTRQGPQQASIHIQPMLADQPLSLAVLHRDAARALGQPPLSRLRAQWWFYHHLKDGVFYTFRTNQLRRWLKDHLPQIPAMPFPSAAAAEPLHGWLFPIETLQTAGMQVLPVATVP